MAKKKTTEEKIFAALIKAKFIPTVVDIMPGMQFTFYEKDGLQISLLGGSIGCKAGYTPWTSMTSFDRDKKLNVPSEGDKAFDPKAKIPAVEKLAAKIINPFLKK